ncbi:MAG TPA: integrin alpha, partial [Candidatus Polarisedimenticolia bacterium]|nr:integrin alpha [Candidatus Polarisedimenticolia bacterium]
MSNRLSGPGRLFLRVAVFAICGLALGGAPLPGGSPTWRVAGGQAAGNLGASVASAGDVNGDGIDDIIVGEPGYDSPATTNPHEGRALVYLGSPLGPSTTPVWTAEGGYSGFGAVVASAGDVNGDGFDDVIVGEPGYGQVVNVRFELMGRAVLFLGSPSGPSPTPSWVRL